MFLRYQEKFDHGKSYDKILIKAILKAAAKILTGMLSFDSPQLKLLCMC